MVMNGIENLVSIDSFMIVDKHFRVVYTKRYNPRHEEENHIHDYSNYMDKNYFEVYPNLKQSDSTMYECLHKGRVVYREQQFFTDYNGQVFSTRNITIPINRQGEIVAAIELSKDLTSFDDLNKKTTPTSDIIHALDYFQEENLTFGDIITNNLDMIENIHNAKVFAKSPNPVLIYGETGTGKELFVQALVNHSSYHRQKFVAQNCGALPSNLMESILFGSVKGAFTGAENRIGLFERANGGVLFLDEFNSLPYELQSKLLRVVENGKIRPVGSNIEKKIQVKVIVAMNMDPIKAIEQKYLREDLFYRLSSNTIKLIPLRDRKEDIILYVNHFIRIFNQRYQKNVEGLSRSMMEIFMNYHWQGNVRELKHIIESMVSLSNDKLLTVQHLPIYMKDRIDSEESDIGFRDISYTDYSLPLKDILLTTERDTIHKVLLITKGHVNNAAKIMEIPRQTLRYRIAKLGINPLEYKQGKDKK